MKKIIFCLIALFPVYGFGSDIPVPVATDSRIKTFVYSENDVFNVVTHYGYQSNIEFGGSEEIETISVGDRVPFQIVPAGRRLFIRALAANARTNMTVVTNKHAYQFDIASVPTPVMPTEELVYVIRFFYPGDKKNSVPVYSDEVKAPPIQTSPIQPDNTGGNNYKYTFSGSEDVSPLKVYDDGVSTYFKFRGGSSPAITSVTGNRETQVPTRRVGEYMVADVIASEFVARQGSAVVFIYNEKISNH